MPKILQLKGYRVEKLHVEWLFDPPYEMEPTDSIDTEQETTIDYDVYRSTESPNLMALRLRLSFAPALESAKVGYDIHAEVFGEFEFPEDIPEQEKEALVRINGGMILYGLLRGQIAAFTGAFPAGTLLLPTIYMQDIVQEVEERKATERRKRATKTSAKRAKHENLPIRHEGKRGLSMGIHSRQFRDKAEADALEAKLLAESYVKVIGHAKLKPGQYRYHQGKGSADAFEGPWYGLIEWQEW